MRDYPVNVIPDGKAPRTFAESLLRHSPNLTWPREPHSRLPKDGRGFMVGFSLIADGDRRCGRGRRDCGKAFKDRDLEGALVSGCAAVAALLASFVPGVDRGLSMPMAGRYRIGYRRFDSGADGGPHGQYRDRAALPPLVAFLLLEAGLSQPFPLHQRPCGSTRASSRVSPVGQICRLSEALFGSPIISICRRASGASAVARLPASAMIDSPSSRSCGGRYCQAIEWKTTCTVPG